MKSITITMHHTNNYGAFLQAFALQQFLGEENEILDYIIGYKDNVGRAKRIPFLWRIISLYKHIKTIRIPILEEVNSLRKTKFFINREQILKSDIKADIFIVGSDQVWSGGVRSPAYLLDFVKENSKKISYAASKNSTRWPKETEEKTIPYLRKFDAISVREESFAEYLRSLGLNAVCVCDPTILHVADFYRKKFNLEENYNSKNLDSSNYIFIYKIRVEILTLVNYKNIVVNLKDRKTFVSVSEWLSLIDNAKFVLTDSFHCIVFSLLFHKSFAVFQNNSELKGMNERFHTILGKTNLEYRLLQGLETEEQILEIVNRPVDWEQVDKILEEWRTYSANWLRNALDG